MPKTALRDHPDLVILDLNLPDVSGIHVAQYLWDSEMLSGTPLIIATGQGNEEMNEAASFNTAACLAKPFDLGQLVCKVEKVLAEYGDK